MPNNRLLKLCCLTLTLWLGIFAGLRQPAWLPVAKAFSSGPDLGRTGAPNELTCATGECHGSQREVNPTRFSVSTPTVYIPGHTYVIVIRQQSDDLTRLRWGFQITALDAAGARAGHWQSLDENVQIVEDFRLQRQYAQHTLVGSFAGQSAGASWTVNWIAPAQQVGPVTFYAAGNQADNNNGNSGDLIFLTQQTIQAGNPTPTPTPTPTPVPTPTPPTLLLPLAFPHIGTLLCFPLFTSDATSQWAENTRVSLTNTHETLPVTVRLVFVSTADATVINQFLRLTPNQTAVLFAAELDPGATGYLFALAVDETNGCPRHFNFLLGEEYVRLTSGHAANFPAETFAWQGDVPLNCTPANSTVTLRFDGVQFTKAPRILALLPVNSSIDGEETLLLLQRFGGDLNTGAINVGDLAGIIYDSQGRGLSFMETIPQRQFMVRLWHEFPRPEILPSEFIPVGHVGWLKLWVEEDAALLGLSLTKSPTGMGAGRVLHKLTATTKATLTLSVLPPVI